MEIMDKTLLDRVKATGGYRKEDYFGQTFEPGAPKIERWIGSILIGVAIGGVVGGLTAGPAGLVAGMVDGGLKAACTQGIIQGINGTQEQYQKIQASRQGS